MRVLKSEMRQICYDSYDEFDLHVQHAPGAFLLLALTLLAQNWYSLCILQVLALAITKTSNVFVESVKNSF